jgi:hypothetical protein
MAVGGSRGSGKFGKCCCLTVKIGEKWKKGTYRGDNFNSSPSQIVLLTISGRVRELQLGKIDVD